ncbi:hypothetical protein ACIHEJ_37530 [Streptomyces sp. NPDC052301]|uniref:hypothetical protein n=1 Tax=Streptomyces sp. NPDC052301 TaxID=3365687 RepID=UPI0037D5C911
MPGRAAEAPAAGRTFHEGASTGADPDIAGFFRATQPRRLVITGAPGSGKTVLALELVLALTVDRAEGDPVPVRISMAQWDTAHTLPELLTEHLTQAMDWPGRWRSASWPTAWCCPLWTVWTKWIPRARTAPRTRPPPGPGPRCGT